MEQNLDHDLHRWKNLHSSIELITERPGLILKLIHPAKISLALLLKRMGLIRVGSLGALRINMAFTKEMKRTRYLTNISRTQQGCRYII